MAGANGSFTLLDIFDSCIYPNGVSELWEGEDKRAEGYVYPFGELERREVTAITADENSVTIHLGEKVDW